MYLSRLQDKLKKPRLKNLINRNKLKINNVKNFRYKFLI